MSRKRRKPSQRRKIKPTYFVFCEGKTEEEYIKFLRKKYRVPILIDPHVAKNRISDRYIKSYKKDKSSHEKDKTFLLYDNDAPKMLEKLRAIPDVELLISTPCIELWFLLHYQEQNAEISTNECGKELLKHNSDYKKGELGSKLCERLDTKVLKACNRAKKLKAYSNPSSTVYLFIEDLDEVKAL